MEALTNNEAITSDEIRVVSSDVEGFQLDLPEWLDGQLAELEERHSGFITRNSLARHLSGQESGRCQR